MSRLACLKSVMAILAATAIHLSPTKAYSSELDIFTIDRSKFVNYQNAAARGSSATKEYVDAMNRAVEDLATDNDAQRAAALAVSEIGIDILVGLCEAGPKTCAGGALGVGVVLGTVLPIIFSAKNSNITMFVANNSDKALYLSDVTVPDGRMAHWPAGKRIPARTRDKVHMGIFVFKKKFGLFGTAGAIEMTTSQDRKFKIGYGLPYRDEALIDNRTRCAISMRQDNLETLDSFYRNKVNKYSGTAGGIRTDSDQANGRNYQGVCGLTDTAGEFPSMLVTYNDSGPSGGSNPSTYNAESNRVANQRERNHSAPAPAIKPNISSPWESDFGLIHWNENYYDTPDKTIVGRVIGNARDGYVYRGTWGRAGSVAQRSVVFQFTRNGLQFNGTYTASNGEKKEWKGNRTAVSLSDLPDLSRVWNSDFGPITWSNSGGQIVPGATLNGTYDSPDKTLRGRLEQDESGWIYIGQWGRTNSSASGIVKFSFSPDGRFFNGRYVNSKGELKNWRGSK